MIQNISKVERFTMLPEDYKLRKQFLLKDCKEELQTILSVMKNNPYSSDLLEYSKSIQNEINDLGYFCILPRPESVNAKQCYERTLNFLNTISEKDCISLSEDQYANIDVFYTLGSLVCKHANKCADLLIKFLPNKEEINEEIRKFEKLMLIFNKARITSLSSDDEEILSRYFLKYKNKIKELKERTTL